MNDLVIRGALIVDGSGSEPATGDVAVLDGVISAVGKHGLTATQLVDGSGLVLAPGLFRDDVLSPPVLTGFLD